jgi:succinate-semialdehyde dehydrogenase/glutarate-semialdehyde dehydrogenase
MDVVNPATGEQVASYTEHDPEVVEEKLTRATQRFDAWSERTIREREELIANMADVLRDNKDEYATTMTKEMGKPISQARAEVEKCAWACEHYAEYSGQYLAPEQHPSPPGTTVKTVHDPIGPVLAVMPWNFPFWQVIRFAAPYLTAGNVGLLKHASNVPGCAIVLEEIFQEAGYPDGVFQTLLIDSGRVDSVLADDRARAATLTGSGPAGRAVAETAGKHLKKTVLELGGSDPFIILDDADLEQAIETGVLARTQNGGQSCIAAKRFFVHEAVYDSFVTGLVERFESLAVGDPMDPDTDVGPLSSTEQLDAIDEQVQASIDAGATILTGGSPLDREGAYYPPTVLADLPQGCPADTEETFGPVAAVYAVDTAEAAVRRANETRFGLGASLWTDDRERGERLAREIDAGCVYVNEMTKSDPRVPFGGVKDSGYGRELSEAGIKEFVNRKTIWVN